ncbi:MAG: DUF4397 domain-containing protein [Bacteroidetes bacterium]|nr:DUF4397 domain-containing protein [Bacteroidota bacterium]
MPFRCFTRSEEMISTLKTSIRTMKNLILVALVLVTGALSAQTARLQVIHNSPEPTVDVYANGGLLLNDFVFRTATPFIDVAAGVPITLDVAPATSTSAAEAIYSVTVTFNAGETYVAIASGVVGDPLTPFNIWVQSGIREAALAAGTVDFIGIHGSPDAPTVDIIARDVAILLDDVSYGAISGYLTVPAGAYVLDVTPGADNYNIVASFAADLSGLGGGSAVVFASGFLSSTPGFGLFAALADGTVVAFPVEAPVFTNLQVIHNSPEPTVDIYVNNTLLLDDFNFRTATPFVPVQALVPVKIDVAPATSTSVSESIYTITGRFRNPSNDYVAIATGVVGDPTTPFNIILQGNIRQSNSVGQVQLVASHGAPDAPTVDVVADGALTLFDNLEYNTISRYISVPPASYVIDIRTEDGLSTVVSYDADLSGLAGGNAVVFASGFLGSSPAFGLYAALPDGTVIAFPVAAPRLSGEVSFEGLFPTVADEQITLTLTGTTTDQVGVTVFNASGQMVIAEVANVDNGRITHNMNVSNLAPGQYFVTVYTQEGPRTERFVIAQ